MTFLPLVLGAGCKGWWWRMLFSPSRKEMASSAGIVRRGLEGRDSLVEVCAGIKGTYRGCWGAVPHLEATRHARPCSGDTAPGGLSLLSPQPEPAVLPFLTCMLLLVFLPLLVTTFLLSPLLLFV